MDPKYRSSFIPKKPLPIQSGYKKKKYRHFDVLSFVSSTIFILAIVASGYVFFVERATNISIESLGVELQEVENSTDFSKVDEYEKFSSQLKLVSTLLNQHKLLSDLFVTLNERTVHGVGFSSLSYITDVGAEELPKVKLSGVAATYNALAVQSDELRRDGIIGEFKFEHMQVGNKVIGDVSFGLVAEVNQEALQYIIENTPNDHESNEEDEITDVIEESDE